jgi:hypothetical protein
MSRPIVTNLANQGRKKVTIVLLPTQTVSNCCSCGITKYYENKNSDIMSKFFVGMIIMCNRVKIVVILLAFRVEKVWMTSRPECEQK